MNKPTEHERILELLKQMQRPAGEVTPERLEENLRWLLRLAEPEVKAPEALRQRVEAIAATRRARPPLAARLQAAFARPRRLVFGTVSLVAATLLIFLVLSAPVPAQALARTLNALAQVKTAHCAGWVVSYRGRDRQGQPFPARMNVQWWYKAPDWFRKDMGPEPPGGSASPGRLFIKGDRNVFISQYHATPGMKLVVPPNVLRRYLSPLDFFSSRGIIRRAQNEKAAQVIERQAPYRDRPVNIVEIEVNDPQPSGRFQERWRLYTDPATDLILRSEARFYGQEAGSAWQLLDEEILDQFEYNISLSDSLFQVEFPPPRSRPTGAPFRHR